MADSLNILAISGSLRAGSFNTRLLRAIEAAAPEHLRLDIITPRGVPLYDGDEEEKQGVPAIVQELQERARAADGIVIATPEYNFSVAGVLKNLIDWLSRGAQQPFNGKRIGIVGASTSPVGTARAQYHLRMSLQALNGLVMPRPEIFMGSAGGKFAEDGTISDEATSKVIGVWLKHFEPWVRQGKG